LRNYCKVDDDEKLYTVKLPVGESLISNNSNGSDRWHSSDLQLVDDDNSSKQNWRKLHFLFPSFLLVSIAHYFTVMAFT
jgi:hypothetical protein